MRELLVTAPADLAEGQQMLVNVPEAPKLPEPPKQEPLARPPSDAGGTQPGSGRESMASRETGYPAGTRLYLLARGTSN